MLQFVITTKKGRCEQRPFLGFHEKPAGSRCALLSGFLRFGSCFGCRSNNFGLNVFAGGNEQLDCFHLGSFGYFDVSRHFFRQRLRLSSGEIRSNGCVIADVFLNLVSYFNFFQGFSGPGRSQLGVLAGSFQGDSAQFCVELGNAFDCVVECFGVKTLKAPRNSSVARAKSKSCLAIVVILDMQVSNTAVASLGEHIFAAVQHFKKKMLALQKNL